LRERQITQHAVLLAAGRGTRLGSLTQQTPKCLLPINGRTMLDRQLEALAGAGIDDVTVVAGFMADEVVRHVANRCRVVVNEHYATTDSITSLALAAPYLRGRAFLLGDAAHIHSPVGAQGMNTGIGDAVNLSWKLAAVLNGAPASLLDTYEAERIAFARRLVATTDRAFTVATKPGPVAALIRTRLFPGVAASLFRLQATRRFLFRTVSQIEINYRQSSLSVGQAGSVRGGDRLPWVPTARSETFADNFAPLALLTWQVHVYGEPTSEVAAECAKLGLPLHAFAWTPDMSYAGIERGAVYLIRPDAYVALADPTGMPGPLADYFSKREGKMTPAATIR